MNAVAAGLGHQAPLAPGETQARARPIIDWLLGDERLRARRMATLIDKFAGRLCDAGLPLDRASLHIQQLHPQLAARSFVWDAQGGGTTEMGFRYSARDEFAYTNSPVRRVFEQGESLRQRLNGPNGAGGYPILQDLARRGFTDYAILPMSFAHGVTNAVSLATLKPEGFGDDDLALFDAVLPAFSTLIELQQTRRTARDLLSTYVGPNTGERIFNGTIRRGDGEIVHAIVWFCDLRGFTAMSQTEPLHRVIELLNTYFDCMAGPVTAHGGEILKFVGDGMLAIFACEAGDTSECGTLTAAIDAAEEAISGMAALNSVRQAVGQAPLECGIAVHIGEVMYGNIGAADRLDFTVIGPAVNMVCNLEALSAPLKRSILVSSEIARLDPARFKSLGKHGIKGIAENQEVFALAQTVTLTGSP